MNDPLNPNPVYPVSQTEPVDPYKPVSALNPERPVNPVTYSNNPANPSGAYPAHNAYPTWVVPHDSYIVRTKVKDQPDVVSVRGWPDYHINRGDNAVTVLVANEDEEKRATGEYKEGTPGPDMDADVKAQVHRDVDHAMRLRADAIAVEVARQRDELVVAEAVRRTAEKREREVRERETSAKLAAEAHEQLKTIVPAVPVDGPAVQEPRPSYPVQPPYPPPQAAPAYPAPPASDPNKVVRPT